MPTALRLSSIISSIFVLALFCFMSLPASAQEKKQDEAARSEFIYRVNLGRADDVNFLLRQGASPHQVSGEGVPVICLAAGRIDPEGINVLKVLVEAGASVKSRDFNGQTALHYAGKAGNIDAVNYLMSKNIDAYALDNNGVVARSAAFSAGQVEAVKAMDNYILRQTAAITKQYKDQNRILQNTRNALANAAKMRAAKTATGTAKADDAKTPDNVASDVAVASDADIKNALVAATKTPVKVIPKAVKEMPQQDEEADIDTLTETVTPASEKKVPPPTAAATSTATPTPTTKSKVLDMESDVVKEEINAQITDMAFNVCAFQYWSYCEMVKQSADLDKEEMIIAITSSKTKAETLKKRLQTAYKLPEDALNGVTTSAQKRIYKELNEMVSNRDRHEQGVGKRDDMQDRCELVARQWGMKAPEKLAAPVNKQKEKSGGRSGDSFIRLPGAQRRKRAHSDDMGDDDFDSGGDGGGGFDGGGGGGQEMDDSGIKNVF